ncbi:MAG: Jag N-terminal domain-containing protein [Clostridia bacterium]|nr:Jag N-terminal domain-containing protein [Clostridia bacterium]
MAEGRIFEGKTTQEAIENGLKALKITKEEAEIKVLENEDKRSFFSILTPRVVRVEITSKKEIKAEKVKRNKEENAHIDFVQAKTQVDNFLTDWTKTIPNQGINYEIKQEDGYLKVDIDGEDLNYLIGHRGETLNQLQVILSSIASKNSEYKVRVILNICGYKEKREKSLEELAEKLEKTVIRTKKSITLEPMTAYERKIIHTKLQNSKKVTTTSIGEEPYRKVVISLK